MTIMQMECFVEAARLRQLYKSGRKQMSRHSWALYPLTGAV